jgi:hypothetical protein
MEDVHSLNKKNSGLIENLVSRIEEMKGGPRTSMSYELLLEQAQKDSISLAELASTKADKKDIVILREQTARLTS